MGPNCMLLVAAALLIGGPTSISSVVPTASVAPTPITGGRPGGSAAPVLSGTGVATASAASPPALDRAAMTTYLIELCEWILALDVGSNHLKGNFTPSGVANDHHIFINGNLARVLLATHKITGNATFLKEGLRWCDKLVSIQYTLETSTGEIGGYWDTGYETIYIADTGTAVTNLVVGFHMSKDATQKASFLSALKRYANFVTKGRNANVFWSFLLRMQR